MHIKFTFNQFLLMINKLQRTQLIFITEIMLDHRLSLKMSSTINIWL